MPTYWKDSLTKLSYYFKRHALVVENVNTIVHEVAKGFTIECCDDDEFVEDEDIVCDSLNDEYIIKEDVKSCCDDVSSPNSESNSTISSNCDVVEAIEQNLKVNHLQSQISNEFAEDFLLLLKEWEQLCASYSLLKINTRAHHLLKVGDEDVKDDDDGADDDTGCCDNDEGEML
ncbi:hypothetical protein H5410_046095 [Solanum commersonii]|uniref:Uncharacterized protein n=1 Tax=Solanum commersonii TaxID=4109 RepID=A0A9J5XDE8_SOLCO|nr:hypothetical protein H5410_046095 [Solanum commersonii]